MRKVMEKTKLHYQFFKQNTFLKLNMPGLIKMSFIEAFN